LSFQVRFVVFDFAAGKFASVALDSAPVGIPILHDLLSPNQETI
jgi:hypothetical protein